MKPTFVIYGNCQAGVLEQATKFMPGVRDTYDVVYLRSFDHPTEGRAQIDPEVLSRCAILWNQLDEATPFTFGGATPPGVKEVTFPAVDMGALWPFQTYDALFGPEPTYTFGLFPYGDSVLIDVAKQGLGGRAGLHKTEELAGQRVVNLDRFMEIELLRLVRREHQSSVRLAAYVLTNFKSSRLFWAYNHPTPLLFREILNRLSVATWPEARSKDHPLYRIGDRVFQSWDPLADLHTPIHPAVAQALGLTWWSPSLRYRFHGSRELTHSEYVKLYLDERIRRQALQS